MKPFLSVLAALFFLVIGPVHADPKADCESKALSKDGKPLAGAAKNANVKKCMKEADTAASNKAKEACESKAVDKNGKPLAGAAKASNIKKCVAETK